MWCSSVTVPTPSAPLRSAFALCVVLSACGEVTVDPCADGACERRDAGTRGSIDAGVSTVAPDGGCDGRFPVMPIADLVWVSGSAGEYGAVDFVVGGYSAGISATTGVQRFTNVSYFNQRAPPSLEHVGLWMWGGHVPIDVNGPYDLGNGSEPSQLVPHMNFQLTPGAACPRGAGSGQFVFSQFMFVRRAAGSSKGVSSSNVPTRASRCMVVSATSGDWEFRCG